MANTYTPNVQLAMPAAGDRTWNVPVNGNALVLDQLAPVGALAVTSTEVPSATLNVRVAAGAYVKQDGTIGTYAGVSSKLMTTSATNYVYLDLTSSGALTVSTSSFPATACVPLATVVAGGSTITSITDSRLAFAAAGSIADGVNLALGSTTGTQIATATTQKLGFWGATPVVQPSGANQAAITDSTGGTASFTLAAVGPTNASDVSGTINNDLASLARQVAAIRAALVAAGIIKGSA